ncbi:hypothetical protein A6J80_14650 [Paracoccus yeei]|mgnify:CR=1 FL=1|uniref:Arginine transporter n=2 Tax=Paracoccus TaxID=265 RepID=A0A1V0GUH9_9RHOB|nr:hypothetical protein A6J80_14650 [Paracoccus yeei]AWX93714.1 hypothetical protein DPM13_13385 [Paracoccus mutanolyticus]AYF00285.1 hypothetical protein PY32053_00608 [Paracoccus yeei]MBY0135347.1 hypothetical protein [Paracoccus yeei]OWJ96490.1 hypothetical protein CDV54_05765 [Paracoccus yeei]
MMNRLMIAAAAVALTTPLAVAGPIDSACIRSERAASPRLCGCIQQVANQTLSRSDQRRAARLFRNADEAQEIRMSKSDADNAFWARYKNFAATAEAYCSN